MIAKAFLPVWVVIVSLLPSSPVWSRSKRMSWFKALTSSRAKAMTSCEWEGFCLWSWAQSGDQCASGVVAGFNRDDVVVIVVGVQSFSGLTGAKVLSGGSLPVEFLAAHFGQVGDAVNGGDAAKRGAGFDGLQLFGVADQEDFGVGFFGDTQHAFELAGADHAGFVDDENVAVG